MLRAGAILGHCSPVKEGKPTPDWTLPPPLPPDRPSRHGRPKTSAFVNRNHRSELFPREKRWQTSREGASQEPGIRDAEPVTSRTTDTTYERPVAMATKRNVVWSKEMYTPSELKERFKEKFPIIVMVARGYYGQTEIDTIGSDQVLILQGWSSQRRAVAVDNRKRRISIPTDYPLQFECLNKNGVASKARPLSDIVNTESLPFRMQFDRLVSSCFYVGANPRCTESFAGELETTAIYRENFLKGNTINAGQLDIDAVTIVPMYMKVHFVVAEGLKGAPPALWDNMKQHYVVRVQHLDFDNVSGNQDLMLYPSDIKPGTEYDLLMPKSYVRHLSVSSSGGRLTRRGAPFPSATLERSEPRYYPLKIRTSSSDMDAYDSEHLYTGLTHAHVSPRSDAPSTTGTGSPRRACPLPTHAHASSGPTEPPRLMPNLAAIRQTRLSDSSTDSSSNSGHSSPIKRSSPTREPRICHGLVPRSTNRIRLPLLSESDSGKGSHCAMEDMLSSDDSDDVFYPNNGRRPTKSSTEPSSIPLVQPIRRNRSESDAPRDAHRGYVNLALSGRYPSSSSMSSLPTVVTNVSYFSLGQLGLHTDGRFRSLDDIPRDISSLTVEDVAQCLRMLNMGMYVRKFIDYQVDGDLLKEFTHEDLNKEFGIGIVMAKKLEKFAKNGWRPKLNMVPSLSTLKRV